MKAGNGRGLDARRGSRPASFGDIVACCKEGHSLKAYYALQKGDANIDTKNSILAATEKLRR